MRRLPPRIQPARRAIALAATLALVVAACGPSPTRSPSSAPSSSPTSAPSLEPSPSPGPQAGGTIYVLTEAEQFDAIDPQQIYAPEDEAFLGATLYRSLEAFVVDPDPITGTTLTPDLATDLGTPLDGGRTWRFTLRAGLTFQDGSPITCEDVKYGVSRSFAVDVISWGPRYVLHDLDIPTARDGSSTYKGPYRKTGQALFDKAVECSADHRTITFHLKQPVGDFNATTTLGMSPVPKAADTGENYGISTPPVSSGPYQVQSYTTGVNGKLTLVRNPNWSPTSDPIRKAYPDNWEVDFGIDPKVLDQRLMASSGTDATAIQYGQVQPENLSTIFGDAQTPTAQFAGRAVSGFDPYVRYYWINPAKVSSGRVRQALMVALDRDAIRSVLGGPLAGDFADGLLKPTIGVDYAPTGIWETFFGTAVSTHGDPELARQLLAEADEPNPTVSFVFADTPIGNKVADVVVGSLGAAGITVKPAPFSAYSCGWKPCTTMDSGDFGTGGWLADWPDASTVIPPLVVGWPPHQAPFLPIKDAAFASRVKDAQETLDSVARATKWQALNREVVENAWVIPTLFGRTQTLAGTNVGPIYRWPAYASWPYAVMYVIR